MNYQAFFTFATVQDLLKSFTKNDKKLGVASGFTAILHTQTRSLDYHPHIHVVIPGGEHQPANESVAGEISPIALLSS